MTEDPLAVRLHRIRQHADNAIRRGEKLDPRLIRDMTTGEAKG